MYKKLLTVTNTVSAQCYVNPLKYESTDEKQRCFIAPTYFICSTQESCHFYITVCMYWNDLPLVLVKKWDDQFALELPDPSHFAFVSLNKCSEKPLPLQPTRQLNRSYIRFTQTPPDSCWTETSNTFPSMPSHTPYINLLRLSYKTPATCNEIPIE
jgi:hypothetical protein